MNRHALIVLTHYATPRIEALVDRARSELAETHDVHVIGLFRDDQRVPKDLAKIDVFRPVRFSDIASLPYPLEGKQTPLRMAGNMDLPFLWLTRNVRSYDSYWLMEGDVDFTGPLSRLVGHFADNPADLLATNVRNRRKKWANMRYAATPSGWPDADPFLTIAFLPLFRASRTFVEDLHDFYEAGGAGHHEWTWPYVAAVRKRILADIGDFPLDGQRLYTSTPDVVGMFPGSFRFRPPLASPGRRQMTLWHPVKDFDRDFVRQGLYGLQGLSRLASARLRGFFGGPETL